MLNKIISILLGFILGYLTYSRFIKKDIYHGPNSKEIQEHVYQTESDEYYKFKPEVCICPI